jgi:hypothetical protein
MANEFPTNDPKNIWQNQPTEAFKMSAEQLRLKAQQRQSRARYEAATQIIIGLVLCIFFARAVPASHGLMPRLGYGLLSVWGIYFACQAYRWLWSGSLKADATISTTLQSYRSELEKRRDYALNIWHQAGLTFCFLGMALVLEPTLLRSVQQPRLLWNVLPIFVLLVIWLVVFLSMRGKRRRHLLREIEELRRFEKER